MEQRKIKKSCIEGKYLKDYMPYLEDCFNIDSRVIASSHLLILDLNDFDSVKHFHPIYHEAELEHSHLASSLYDKAKGLELFQEWELSDQWVHYLVTLFVEHVYLEQTVAPCPSIEDIDYSEQIIDEFDYIDNIRPDMLELYRFINDWKSIPQDKPITLICGNKKLKLNNNRNWMFKAFNDYLEEHLGVESVEEAETELARKYSKKTGRKANKYQTLVIYGLDKLYQNIKQTEEITNQHCQFIRDYLKYLGMPISEDGFDHDDDIKNIRSRIRYLRKTGCSEQWVPSIEEIMEKPIFNGW